MNWGIKLLQSSALPLGYGALFNYIFVFYNYAHILKNFYPALIIMIKDAKICVFLSVGAEDEIRTATFTLAR